jgi:hypothetical protein
MRAPTSEEPPALKAMTTVTVLSGQPLVSVGLGRGWGAATAPGVAGTGAFTAGVAAAGALVAGVAAAGAFVAGVAAGAAVGAAAAGALGAAGAVVGAAGAVFGAGAGVGCAAGSPHAATRTVSVSIKTNGKSSLLSTLASLVSQGNRFAGKFAGSRTVGSSLLWLPRTPPFYIIVEESKLSCFPG